VDNSKSLNLFFIIIFDCLSIYLTKNDILANLIDNTYTHYIQNASIIILFLSAVWTSKFFCTQISLYFFVFCSINDWRLFLKLTFLYENRVKFHINCQKDGAR